MEDFVKNTLLPMPEWRSNTLHTYIALVSTASRLAWQAKPNRPQKFCITWFIAHFPSAIRPIARGTEQQVTWSFNFQVFSQRRLAADYNIDAGGVILEFHQHCSAEHGCYERLAIGKALQVRLLSEGHTESRVSDSQPQTDEGLC